MRPTKAVMESGCTSSACLMLSCSARSAGLDFHAVGLATRRPYTAIQLYIKRALFQRLS